MQIGVRVCMQLHYYYIYYYGIYCNIYTITYIIMVYIVYIISDTYVAPAMQICVCIHIINIIIHISVS